MGVNGNNGNGVCSGVEKRQLEVLCDRVPLSDFISLVSSEDCGEFAIIETTEGLGIAFEVFVPSYMGQQYEDNFRQIFSISYPVGTIINFFAYASNNIQYVIDLYRQEHSYRPNVANADILLSVIERRAEYCLQAAENGFWPGESFGPRLFRNIISFLVPYSAFNDDVEATYDRVRELAPRIRGLLTSCKVSPQKFDGSAIRTLFKEIFNDNFAGIALEDPDRELRNQIIEKDTRISVDRDSDGNTDIKISRNGKSKFLRVMSVSKYPKKMTLWEFNNLAFNWKSKEVSPALSSPFGFSLSVKYVDWKKRKERLGMKAAWNIKQEENNPFAKYIMRIGKKSQESKYVMDLLDEGAIPLPSYFSMFFVERSKSRLDAVVYEVLSKFNVKGFEFEREIDKGMMSLFLDMLPLCHISERDNFLNKRATLFDANIASMIPFIAGVTGRSARGEMYVCRKGQISFFDRFESETSFNMIKIAESGGGKSFSQANSHVHSLTAKIQVRVIDVGRSYENLCRAIGGTFIAITRDRKPCFNFFTFLLADKHNPDRIDEDEMDSVVPLVAFLCGYDISKQVAGEGNDNTAARVASVIIEAVSRAFAKKHNEAGLKEVADEFLNMDDPVGDKLPQNLWQTIYPYSHGVYSSYFNGHNNIEYSGDYVVLELEEVELKDARLQAAIIFSVIVRVLREVYIDWRDRKRRTVVDVDEAWAIVTKVSAKSFFMSATRRFRKYESGLGFLTQLIDDLFETDTTRAIHANAAHKIYLSMQDTNVERADAEKKLGMDEFSKETFKTIQTVKGKFSEIFFDSQALHGAVRLVLDRYSYGLFTTKGNEKIRMDELEKEFNIGIAGVLEMLTKRQPVGDVLVGKFGLSRLAVDLALGYQLREARERKLGDILIEMGVTTEDVIGKALKFQEEQLTWEKVFRR